MKEELRQLLAALPADCSERYVHLSAKQNFDEEAFFKKMLHLFSILKKFNFRFLVVNNMPIGEAMVEQSRTKIDELKTDDPAFFLEKADHLATFLNNFQLPSPTERGLGDENTSELNRRVIDEALKPQATIIDDKKMEIVHQGGAFDETAFQNKNTRLIFFRNIYWAQLKTNEVEAGLDDLFDCLDANALIKESTADTFLDAIDNAREVIKSKIEPDFS